MGAPAWGARGRWPGQVAYVATNWITLWANDNVARRGGVEIAGMRVVSRPLD